MQKITQADIKKFQTLYKRHFDVVLSDDDARKELSMLLVQIQRIYKPIPRRTE
jgi:hypothetical protein